MESLALEVHQVPTNTPKEKVLYEIKDRGLYYWNENRKLTEEVEALHLKKELLERNKLLQQYCDLRIRSYTMLYKAIEEGSTETISPLYADSVEYYNREIVSVMDRLNAHNN
jgi:rhomboid protease GluP